MRSTVSENPGQNSPIIVLGATGRLGRSLVRFLPAGAARFQTRGPALGPNWVQACPLNEPGALARACRGAEVMIDLTGITPGRAGADLAQNTDLACAAWTAAAEAGLRHVFLPSSGAVYGNHPGPHRETGPTAPHSAYGKAKLDMETAIAARAGNDGPGVTLLRIGNVAGADQLGIAAAAGAPLRLSRFAGGRSPLRSYIGPLSFADCLLQLAKLARRGTALPPVLNLAAPEPVYMADLLHAAGHDWTDSPAGPGELAELVLDTTALTRLCPLPASASGPARIAGEWRRSLDADAPS